ncbi:ABC transporter permease subunit [Arthrobacter sp. zg-Y877]|uniref:ABC transporter permease subunit n=1 Tax=Arthrobacter sp. zg-Y877 TaxID=3049074 RepID=UPI0025A36860|nr:ABC transporter permease subunit [Arthrobacter sp. zg-Y877]MDM7989481.1 ABC transporter permease subunit [Arthrobacter sp. zg-Y877]
MSRLPLFSRSLAASWRPLLGWAAGILAVLSLYLPLYPSLAGQDFQDLLQSLPPELISALGYDELTTGAGYTQSTFFGLIGFVLFTIAAISWGTRAIAGDEESGTLELVLAHAVSRVQLVLERSAAIAARLLLLGLFTGLAVLAFDRPAQLVLIPSHVWAGCAALVGLALLTASVALAAGAFTGRRVWALAAAVTAAVGGYALNAVANQNPDLDYLHSWTPYNWAFGASPLSNGADWAGLGALYGTSALLVLLAAFALTRRDIGT